jgi:HAD superfamily hydrolase (TIGR01509 family)
VNHSSFEAIIFDHDGTLVDTETPDFEACRMLCQEYNLTLSEDYWADIVVGRIGGYDTLYHNLFEPTGITLNYMKQRLEQLWTITLRNTELMPGVIELLAQLSTHGYRLAVATAADRAWVEQWLGHFKITSFFDSISTSDDIVNNKPAPDVYLHAAQQLGIAPQKCLVFEDSPVGVQAARAAQMTVVAVPNRVTRNLKFEHAHSVVRAGLAGVNLDWIASITGKNNA